LVISRMLYQAAGNSTLEYIVLQNIGTTAQSLQVACAPLSLRCGHSTCLTTCCAQYNSSLTAKISGIGPYYVPAGVTLSPGQLYYIASVGLLSRVCCECDKQVCAQVNDTTLRSLLSLSAQTLVAAVPFTGSLSVRTAVTLETFRIRTSLCAGRRRAYHALIPVCVGVVGQCHVRRCGLVELHQHRALAGALCVVAVACVRERVLCVLSARVVLTCARTCHRRQQVARACRWYVWPQPRPIRCECACALYQT
jgi:hypothetical protein